MRRGALIAVTGIESTQRERYLTVLRSLTPYGPLGIKPAGTDVVEEVVVVVGAAVAPSASTGSGKLVLELSGTGVEVVVDDGTVVPELALGPGPGPPAEGPATGRAIGVVWPGFGFHPAGGLACEGTGPAFGTTVGAAGCSGLGVSCGGTGVPE